MSLERLFQAILYFGLLSGAMVFVIKSVNDFMQGDTGYTQTHELLTPHDIPALVFCFDIDEGTKIPVYRLDFSINSTIYHDKKPLKTIELVEKKGVDTALGLNILLSRTQAFRKGRHCYKIQTTWKGGDLVQMQGYRQFFKLQYLNPNLSSWIWPPNKATWYVVSDKNSHGMIEERFFDGNCEKNILSKGYHHTLTVVEVKEYINLDSICSHDSYYECLAKRFANVDFTEVSNPAFEQYKSCSYKKVFCPFRLSFADDSIPLCKNNIEAHCYEDIMGKLKETQEKYCKKLCQAKEFKTVLKSKEPFFAINDDGYSLWLEFRSLHASLDLRTTRPAKFVMKEYFIVNAMSLVGNIGGTQGMFVGFSFITTSEWFLHALLEFWSRICGSKLSNPQ